jgi:hypothetical protein
MGKALGSRPCGGEIPGESSSPSSAVYGADAVRYGGMSERPPPLTLHCGSEVEARMAIALAMCVVRIEWRRTRPTCHVSAARGGEEGRAA